MTLITMPSSPVPSQVDWNMLQPSQVNTSDWTGKRRVTILPAPRRWQAKVSLPMLIGEDAVLAWRVFMTACNGRANSFLLRGVERPQVASAITPYVTGSGQTGTGLVTHGWPVDGTILRAGNMVSLATYQMLVLAADAVVASGAATLHFTTDLRVSPDANSAVQIQYPSARMAMTSDTNGWSATKGQQYPIAFECEEAFD